LAGLITGNVGQGVEPYEAAVLGGYVMDSLVNLAAETLGNTRSVSRVMCLVLSQKR